MAMELLLVLVMLAVRLDAIQVDIAEKLELSIFK